MRSSLAIIPARSGSKRIPNKNIKSFLGSPILSYAIKSARESNLFEKIIVSTDNKEYASLSQKYGAEVPFIRASHLSDDFASTVDVIIDSIESLSKDGHKFDFVCCLYPTTPLININHLQDSYQKFENSNSDSMITVQRYHHPIQRSLISSKGKLCFKYPEFKNCRTQDLETTFHDAGQFYWMKTSEVLKQKTIFMNNTTMYELDEYSAQDIDNESDWLLAELKYKTKYGN